MKYGLREAIRYIASNVGGVDMTDDEVSALIRESGEAIEDKGRAVREAAQKYESFVIELAAAKVSERSTTEPEAHMDASQHRN